jgi:hypothetical protein
LNRPWRTIAARNPGTKEHAYPECVLFTEEAHMQIQSATERPLYEVDGEVVCGT